MSGKIKILFFVFLSVFSMKAQKNQSAATPKPKLVVGIVVDQMRWDFLYRYESKYGSGGFKRLLHQGYSLSNVMIDYVPTVTALGHTSIYTGSVPSIHGIAGNDWTDRETGKNVYCTTDASVKGISASSEKIGAHSPHNLWSTTSTHQLARTLTTRSDYSPTSSAFTSVLMTRTSGSATRRSSTGSSSRKTGMSASSTSAPSVHSAIPRSR